VHKVAPSQGHKATCPRCGRILLRYCRETIARSLALAYTGLFLYFPAVFLPLLTFQKLGMSESGTILQTILKFIHQEYYIVAIVVFLAAVVFPFIKLSFLATVSTCLALRKHPFFLGRLFRAHCFLDEWAMLEVYLLGISITVVKMHHSTEISFNLGFYCFAALVLVTLAASLTICRESFWALIESRGQSGQQFPLSPPTIRLSSGDTAASHNLVLCRECGKLIPSLPDNIDDEHFCDRCGARLHLRKPASISRTWAFIATAAILIFPANLLPMMHVEFMGIPSKSTILDGIRQFFQDGSYIIAMIILAASILIPLFKIVGLAIVLLTVSLKRRRFLRHKTIMYRFIEFIGRWSMLDIFVIALLGFFINFGFLTTVETAPAATYFCLVVISTMLATLTFDPRLMWDMESHERPGQNRGE
jgi:paraquat-inducible protein A